MKLLHFIAKLSPENYRRIQEAGLIKPINIYLEGVNRGTENIARKAGFNIRNLYGFDQNAAIKPILGPNGTPVGVMDSHYFRGAHTNAATNMIETAFKDPSFFKNKESADMFRALINRHEAYEAMAVYKARQRLSKNSQKSRKLILNNMEKADPGSRAAYGDNTLYNYAMQNPEALAAYNTKQTGLLWGSGPNLPYPIQGGTHFDIDVLTKERKLLDRTPYRYNNGVRHLRRMRKMMGEDQYLNNSGGYNPHSLERYNNTNAGKTYAYGKNPQKPIPINGKSIQEMWPFF